MTMASPSSGFSARGRVVVVGDGAAPPRINLPQTRRITRAANLFDAVGEVTAATSAEPVAAVVVPLELVRGSAATAIRALRRVDPSVRLILLARPHDEPAETEAGFDAVVVEPVGADELEKVLSSEPTPKEHRVPHPGGAGPIADEPLGDTDLVESVMNDPGGLLDKALALVAQQTRWPDLALTDERPKRDGIGAAEVRHGRRSFGILSCAQATESQLQPWADWLGRWLALDRSYRNYRMMAYHDELTGAWNRRFYRTFMKRTIRKAARRRRPVTVLVFDIDDFKQYNDRYGHQAGDDVLKETVALLNSVIRTGDKVCRIGGDEFVVIFADSEGPRKPGSNPPETVEEIATRFQDQLCQMKFPKLGLDAPGTLSISGGLATYPWDGQKPETLLRRADQLALQSKRKGKNVITMGPGMSQICRRSDEVTE